MPIIRTSLGMRERSEVCLHLIISKGFVDETGWLNHLHHNNDFGSNAATIKAMKLIGSLHCVEAKIYYLNKYFRCTRQKNYCRATTCCWKVMEIDHFIHQQYFVNTTSGVVFNLSSDIFSDDVKQIGATCYGGLSKHCASMPIYVSKDGRCVRI